MRHLAICILIASFAGTPVNENPQPANHGNGVEQQEKTAMDAGGVVDSVNRFCLDLYQQLRSEDGNLFFSPSSISVALAMTYAGAEGETETEMAKTLHFLMPEDQLHQGMQAIQSLWTSTDKKTGIKLNLANRLWGQENYGFLDSFMQVTRERYAAELARLDFVKSEEARQTINQWVEEQTENKITDLIPKGIINDRTRLILTNAVYFHGTWTTQFTKELTGDGEFHLDSSSKIQVPLMNSSGRYGYAEFDDLKVLELPYGDGSLSMVVLLPNESDGLPDLEARLTLENLQQWITNLHKHNVNVTLPRFKTTSKFQMNETLQSLGMISAFDSTRANFSGMTERNELFIAAVVHKAFVDVNEEGTEAAAATGVIVERASLDPANRRVFRADHPFVFLIRDNRNGAILFMGRMGNPSE